jgi:hypothetical protein
MMGFGYVVSSRLNTGYLRLAKTHPRVVPLLLTATFPDTTPVSLDTVSDWVRSFNLNHLVPEESLKGFLSNFTSKFTYPIAEYWTKGSEYHTASLDQYFPKIAQGCKEVSREIETETNLILKSKVDKANITWEELLKEIRFGADGGAWNSATYINKMWDVYVMYLDFEEGFPKWLPPQIEEIPPHWANVTRWVRFKLRSLESISLRYGLPWRALLSAK